MGGGTGAGMGAALEERLSVEYGKKYKVGFKIFNSPDIKNGSV